MESSKTQKVRSKLITANANRRKGFGYERELVNDFIIEKLKAKRAYGSDGRSLGLDKKVDLLIENKVAKYTAQCKRVRKLPQLLSLEEVDFVLTRQDNGETIVLMRFSQLIKFLKGEECESTLES